MIRLEEPSLIAQRYSFPSPVQCSVMSASHSWFTASAVKSRRTWSSWTGRSGLLAVLAVLLSERRPPTQVGAELPRGPLGHLLAGFAGLVDQEPVAELRVVAVGVDRAS